MTFTMAAARPDLRESFLRQTKAYANADEATRLFGAVRHAKAMSKAWDRSSVAVRNLVLHDALALLDGQQLAEQDDDWEFVETNQLKVRLQKLVEKYKSPRPASEAHEALDLLKGLVERVDQDTYPDYQAFAKAQRDFRPAALGDAGEALERYEQWIRRYRPYLVLGVPLTDEAELDAADRMVTDRVDFFLSKNPDEFLTDRYRDRLWTYVFDVRSALRSHSNRRTTGGR